MQAKTAPGALIELVGYVDAKRLKLTFFVKIRSTVPGQRRGRYIWSIMALLPSFRRRDGLADPRFGIYRHQRNLAKQSWGFAVQVVICVLATSRCSIGARSGAL